MPIFSKKINEPSIYIYHRQSIIPVSKNPVLLATSTTDDIDAMVIVL